MPARPRPRRPSPGTGPAARAAALLSLLAGACVAPPPADGAARYDVVWNQPGQGPSDSMPLGNGDISLNVWTEPDGDLLFYIGKTDSWGDNGRLLKVGRLRFELTATPPLEPGTAFVQQLHLDQGTVRVAYGAGDRAVELRVWVDANHPVVEVAVDGPRDLQVTATIEPWRTARHTLPALETSDVLLGSSTPTIVEPDVILTDRRDDIGWYHHNVKSVGPTQTARQQGLADFPRPDPLLHRTFGALVTAAGGVRLDDRRLRSPAGARHRFRIPVHTAPATTPAAWLRAVEAVLQTARRQPPAARRAAHLQWWRAFWNRSWIHVTGNRRRPSAGPLASVVPANPHPVRLGIDQAGGSRFPGELGRVSVYGRALAPAAIATLAGHREPVTDALHSGSPAVGDRWPRIAGRALHGGVTIEAWVRPTGGGGRIFDKIRVGGNDGVLLDVHPVGHLRGIVGSRTLSTADAVLTKDTWQHVALVADTERLVLFVGGAEVARLDAASVARDRGADAAAVARGYALQRFVNACAGRGRYPIKFNGSILTVPHPGTPGDADYRRWGPGYWWQNTRLPYISMCTSGDFEMMRPLFRMYGEELMPLFRHRTEKYFGHPGAFIPECIYFWGEVFTKTYGPQPFEARTDKLQDSGWHKWEWVAGPELVFMMLDYHAHTGDREFLQQTLLPAADAILTFFDRHYETGADGKLVMHPAQALETWWNCTDPMPEVAGLQAVVERLLALPDAELSAARREYLTGLQTRLPALPVRTVDDATMLAPAARFADKRNIENPELYAVFPFRRVAFDKPNAALGIRALRHRLDRGHAGWRQDDVFMAYLGLAAEARDNLVRRARSKHTGSRFDAFWGPNYDWVPDQDHGGILLKALQAMALQTDGDTIHLLPAWPADWDVSLRLHAPRQTVIDCEVQDGEVRSLRVTPASRGGDVIVHRPQAP